MTFRLTQTGIRLSLTLTLATPFVACGGMEGDGEEIVDEDPFDSAYQDGKEDAVRTGRFEVFTGSDTRTYFHLLASNGQKVLGSQDYASVTAAKEGIASVKSNVTSDARIEFRESADAQWYFVVKAANGAVVGVSELYTTRSSADRALTSVRSTAPTATTKTIKSAAASFQVFKGIDGTYYFHVRAKNGEILVQSESYATRSAAVSGSASVTTNASTASRYEVRDARGGQAYFVLKAANGQLLVRSELYANATNASRARDAFIALFKSGTVTAAK